MVTGSLGKALLTTEKLLERLQEHFLQEDFSLEIFELLKYAWAFAEEHYASLVHPIGKPYLLYAAEVAIRLSDLHADPMLIAAGMIYPPSPVALKILDSLKKNFKDKDDLVKLVEEIRRFDQLGWNVWPVASEQGEAREVKERREILQKMFLLSISEFENDKQEHILPTALHFQKKEKQIENTIRMFLAAAPDIRALIFKLVDHLYFIKFLKDVPQPQQELIHAHRHAKITLAIYAPLADRLGLWHIKSELEDMAFRLLQPDTYKKIAKQLDATQALRKKHINDVIPIIRTKIDEYELRAEISGRAKHIYSIYQKMEAKQLDIEEINDLLGIRIVVDNDEDCYNILGILHEYWMPITTDYGGKAGRDWIANPKENLYQSLHTTIGIADKIVEVQIRTRAMHETAEYGAASAHWRYKENKSYRKGKTPQVTKSQDRIWSEQLATVRKILESDQRSVSLLQKSLLNDRIFVITPEGHVIDLAAGATALDFAYRVHTSLGHTYVGAKVNGHQVRADHELNNGDIIEIHSSRTRKGPNPEWLSKSRLDDELKSLIDNQIKNDETSDSSLSHPMKRPSPQWLYRPEGENEVMYYSFARTRQARYKIRHWFNMQKPKE